MDHADIDSQWGSNCRKYLTCSVWNTFFLIDVGAPSGYLQRLGNAMCHTPVSFSVYQFRPSAHCGCLARPSLVAYGWRVGQRCAAKGQVMLRETHWHMPVLKTNWGNINKLGKTVVLVEEGVRREAGFFCFYAPCSCCGSHFLLSPASSSIFFITFVGSRTSEQTHLPYDTANNQ